VELIFMHESLDNNWMRRKLPLGLLAIFISFPVFSQTNPGQDLLLDRAFSYYYEQNWQLAEQYFMRYVSETGDTEVALRYLGRLSIIQGKYNEAVNYLNRAIVAQPATIESYMLLSDLHLKLGQVKNATNTLEKVLTVDPFNERTLSTLAYLSQQTSDHRKSAVYQKRLILAVRKGSNNPNLLEQSYQSLGGYYYSQGKYNKSIDYYEKLTEIAPNQPAAQLVLGELYKLSGDFESSAKRVKIALSQKPDYKAALESLIETQFILNDVDVRNTLQKLRRNGFKPNQLVQAIQDYLTNSVKGEQSFRASLKKNPNRLSAHIGLVRSLLANPQPDKPILTEIQNEAYAVVILSQRIGATKLARKYASLVFASLEKRAKILNFNKSFYQEVMDNPLGPEIEQLAIDHIELYSTHGTTLESLNQNNQAIAFFHRAEQVCKKLEEWYNKTGAPQKKHEDLKKKRYKLLINSAWLYYDSMINDRNSSLAMIERALELFPKKAPAHFVKGVINFSIAERGDNRLNSAVSSLKTAIEIAEEGSSNKVAPTDYYFYRALAEEKNDNFPDAEKDLQRTINIEPFNPTYLNYLGYMYSVRGIKLQDAFDLLERALEDDPENEAYLDSLGWTLFKMGKHGEALEQLLLAVNQAQKKNITDAVIFYHLAETYQALKNNEMALLYYGKALEVIATSSEPLNESHIRKQIALIGKE
jgi:tetratricopeptide (TPR) repeat protein